MNAYLSSQLPLLLGFGLLLALAAWRPKGSPHVDVISQIITLVAIGLAAVLTESWLVPGEEFFGGAIRVTVIGRALAYGALGLAFLAALLSTDYLAKIHARPVEFRMVLLAQAIGIFHLPLAGDLATLFIAFELVSIPSYVLAGFNHRDARANEAGMKYLLLGALSSALFLLGLAFLYGATGEITYSAIQNKIGVYWLSGSGSELLLAKVSLALLLASLLFKVAAAPFHAWLPDVYQGTNFASLAAIASPAKVALFGLIAMLLWGPFAYLHDTWKPLLILAALLSAVFGNLQALSQSPRVGLKRVLAFSSTVNAGFILLALFLDSAAAFLFYLMAYGITVIGVLAALMCLGTATADVEGSDDLRGAGRRRPWIAAALTVFLFSLAGIPLTAGFAGKFAVVAGSFAPGFEPVAWYLPVLIASVVFGLVSFVFYFRIVRALWQSPASSDLPDSQVVPEGSVSARAPGFNAAFVTGFCAFLVILLGVLMRMPGMP
jgi:NADH-quinone oxidoreductase subunit N